MSNYIDYKVKLTEMQIRKLKKAHDSNENVKLKISYYQLCDGCVSLPLTSQQINQINKKKLGKQGVQLTLSRAQLKHINKVTGGFLPLLAALIPAAIGAAGGLAGGIATAVNSTKQANEAKRHNQKVEELIAGQGIGEPTPISGKSLRTLLKQKFGLGCCIKGVQWGNGLYLEREGKGVFLNRQK